MGVTQRRHSSPQTDEGRICDHFGACPACSKSVRILRRSASASSRCGDEEGQEEDHSSSRSSERPRLRATRRIRRHRGIRSLLRCFHQIREERSGRLGVSRELSGLRWSRRNQRRKSADPVGNASSSAITISGTVRRRGDEIELAGIRVRSSTVPASWRMRGSRFADGARRELAITSLRNRRGRRSMCKIDAPTRRYRSTHRMLTRAPSRAEACGSRLICDVVVPGDRQHAGCEFVSGALRVGASSS